MEEKARFNVKYMEEMKLYTHEEMLDRVIGTKGTPAREKYETDINNFLICLHPDVLSRPGTR